MNISSGTLLWVSVQPLIRLLLNVGCGFVMAKLGILSPACCTRYRSDCTCEGIAFPMLMFSKIIPVFNSQNISALGPLVLVALTYETIGITLSWLIKQIFWVPHRFRYGILIAGGWANVGDIPTSVVMTLMASAPFNGTQDENLAVAYLAAFLLVFCVTLFTFGAVRWLETDFDGPDIEDEEIQAQLRLKQKRVIGSLARLGTWMLCRRSKRTTPGGADSDLEACETVISTEENIHSENATSVPTALGTEGKKENLETTAKIRVPATRRILRGFCNAVRSASSPPSLSIVISFIISVVPTLKALFVAGVPGVNMPSAPDGQPPLAFLLDTATFIGAASVPIGLMTLGSAIARLEIPSGSWRKFPLASIGALATARLVVMPILGVLICQGLTHVGFISAEDKVLRFVCIFFSCLPTATTQVYLTQVYSGTGTAGHLSAYLIPQYILMIGTMTGLTAYTLRLLFG
ncbi:auxin efflux carrier [Pisolithus orientalis]|uniref:auxin efflux carrier n=1 Tax=Pisolithus orientalis TaxID=936130 RepID=UPI0022253657|nr:auxin efflux carrier [Pisolithus orientalis]KAI6032583.1 auxin efflux carrier [Pisolithus orientalis]